MKKYILLALLSLISTALFAQKELKSISYRSFELPLTYIQYPSTPLGPAYKSYQLIFVLPENLAHFSVAADFAEALEIKGFEDVETSGDLQIKLHVSNFEFQEPKIISLNSQNEESAIHVYYHYTYSLELLDTKTNKVLSKQAKTTKRIGEERGEVWTKGYQTKASLNKELNSIEKIHLEIIDKVLGRVCENAGHSWSNQYGTQTLKHPAKLLRIYEKEYYETYFYLSHLTKLKRIFSEKVSLSNPPILSKDEIEPFLDYLTQTTTNRKNLSQKAINTITALCYYNTGRLYFLYDDPAKAIEFGEKALATTELQFEATELINESKALINIFEKNGVTSRYKSN